MYTHVIHIPSTCLMLLFPPKNDPAAASGARSIQKSSRGAVKRPPGASRGSEPSVRDDIPRDMAPSAPRLLVWRGAAVAVPFRSGPASHRRKGEKKEGSKQASKEGRKEGRNQASKQGSTSGPSHASPSLSDFLSFALSHCQGAKYLQLLLHGTACHTHDVSFFTQSAPDAGFLASGRRPRRFVWGWLAERGICCNFETYLFMGVLCHVQPVLKTGLSKKSASITAPEPTAGGIMSHEANSLPLPRCEVNILAFHLSGGAYETMGPNGKNLQNHALTPP